MKKSVSNGLFKYSIPPLVLSAQIFAASGTALAINPVEDSTPEVPVIHSAEQTFGVQLPQPHSVNTVDRNIDLKGWNHIFTLLVDQGINPQYLADLFSDPRMPVREQISFALEPKESKHLYRRHNTPKARRNALRFYREHQPFFKKALATYEVPESIVLSILQIETGCGGFVGRERVFPRLVRLAQAAAPDIIQRNFEEKVRTDKRLSIFKVKDRAQWLERTFLPHAVAAISVAKHKGIDPFELRGSAAGALGFPQFLPGHYFTHGVDGDGDGRVDLFTAPDAILSVAKYLKAHGWRQLKLSSKEQQQVIWNYNRSKPYIDTVLAMSTALNKTMAGEPAKKKIHKK